MKHCIFLVAIFLSTGLAVADPDPSDWVTINKDLGSRRYVELDRIDRHNVKKLSVLCEARLNEPGWFGSGIVKVDRTLYVTTLRATYAVDAVNCKPLWRTPVDFKYPIASYFATRGVGYSSGRLFRGTNDSQLMALDAKTGRAVWSIKAADSSQNESVVAAPVVWNGKVFVGIASSDKGIMGRLMAFDADSGKELWRFQTIQMGNEQGGGFWTTVSVDPATGEVIAPVSNPTPIFYPEARPGPNFYTNSVISVDAHTGKLNWYFQAVPRDDHDWDLSAAPSLYRTAGEKSMLVVTGKSGRVYGVERFTRSPVFDTPATTLAHDQEPLGPEWKWVCPGLGAQYNGTAHDPQANALYVGMVDWCRFFKSTQPTSPTDYAGGSTTPDYSVPPAGRITALHEETGEIQWEYRHTAPFIAGLVTTRGGLLFVGDVRGQLLAFDAANGAIYRRLELGAALNNGLISYAVKDRQYLAVAAGGASMVTAGVAGALRVAVLGLGNGKKPAVTRFPRLKPDIEPEAVPQQLYLSICGNCHGQSGMGGLYPSLMRNGHLADPARLRKFLATVPAPMPQLYPGLLKKADVKLIADYLRTDIFQCGQPGGQNCQPYGRPKTGGIPEWRQIYSVLTHPRCLNCHTATDPASPATQDYPRQTDERRPHLFNISRGEDNKGLLNGRCDTCHGATNNPITGAPGAGNDGQTAWQLAPASMAWETTPGTPMNGSELCSMLKDPAKNGGLDLQGLLKHVDTEVLVNWAWHPGLNARGGSPHEAAHQPRPVCQGLCALDRERGAMPRCFWGGNEQAGRYGIETGYPGRKALIVSSVKSRR